MPEDGEVAGLLALMLLTEACRTARVSASGELVALDEQDRGAWDAALVAEGHRLVRERLAAGVAPGRYQILAAINAVHTSARDIRDTGLAPRTYHDTPPVVVAGDNRPLRESVRPAPHRRRKYFQ
jgi:predicted RNA polymerase sigma factor